MSPAALPEVQLLRPCVAKHGRGWLPKDLFYPASMKYLARQGTLPDTTYRLEVFTMLFFALKIRVPSIPSIGRRPHMRKTFYTQLFLSSCFPPHGLMVCYFIFTINIFQIINPRLNYSLRISDSINVAAR